MADTTISMYISDISVLLRVSITSRKHAIGIQDKQRCPWPASLNPGRNLSIHPDQAVLPMPPTCMMREGNPDRQTKHPREINTGVSGRGLERRYVVEKIPSMLWGAYMISGHSNAYPPPLNGIGSFSSLMQPAILQHIKTECVDGGAIRMI